MRVLILANGDPPAAELARREAARHDLMIATDGAAGKAAALGVRPDLICGDFDSIDAARARRDFPDAEFVETPDQDLADLEKALHIALDRGAQKVTLIGAGGGRVDHSLTSVALLLQYHRAADLAVLHDGSAIRAVSGSPDAPGALRISTRQGNTISLIAFSPAAGISLAGVEWPLADAALAPGTHAVSNVATGDAVELEIRNGAIVVCHLGCHDRE